MDEVTRESIEALLDAHSVVLFMKGARAQPQCGFSATTVKILDTLIREYETVDVLADATIREGIKAAAPFDDAAEQLIETLPKDTPLVFHCHSGGRSQVAAERYRLRGFVNVSNLAGGIDAWSFVDPTVPRY